MTERSRRERTIRKRVAANSGLSVGVVIRTKNRPIFLTRSLASLAGQTHANWHAVIVNDGGAPAPIREVLQSEKFREYFNSGKVQIIDHRESVGRGRAFNAGLAKLTTDMCCCLDDDDAWGPDFLRVMTERMIELKEFSTNIGGVCGRVTDVKETMLPEDLRTGLTSGKAFSKEIARHKLLDYNNAEEFISPVLYLLQQHNCLPVQLMFDREKLSEFGGFSEHREVLEDRSLLAPFLTKYRIGIARDAMSYHYVRVKESNNSDYKNSMGDNENYDWTKLFRTIESDMFYGDRADSTSRSILVAHDAVSYIKWHIGKWSLSKRNRRIALIFLLLITTLLAINLAGSMAVLYMLLQLR